MHIRSYICKYECTYLCKNVSMNVKDVLCYYITQNQIPVELM